MVIAKQDLPALLLRVGLAIIFLYAAIGSFVAPKEWIGYFPSFVLDNLPAQTVLKVFSVYELLLAGWLISGVYVRYAALVAVATLAGIILANFNLFQITFRDIALIFAALALATLTWDKD